MKTLIINGSPHTDGSTSALVDMLAAKLKGDIDIIRSYDAVFSPCIDCKSCMKDLSCPLKDSVTALLDNIDCYDCIAAAAPLYFNQPTGSFLSLASRFQREFARSVLPGAKPLKEKKGAVILCGGGDCIVNSADAEKTMRIVLKQLNVKVVAYARSLHTSVLPVWEDKVVIEEINKMAEILNAN